jgi:hypothetical protein
MGNIDWISLAQDRDRWRTFMNTLMNLGFHKVREYLDWLRTCYILRKNSAPWS